MLGWFAGSGREALRFDCPGPDLLIIVNRVTGPKRFGRGGLEKGGRAVSPTEALPRLESFRKPARRAGVGMKEALRWGKIKKAARLTMITGRSASPRKAG